MLEGKRVPIAVAAPEVYSPNDAGGIAGGSAEHSAVQALDLIRNKYGKEVQSFMVGKYILLQYFTLFLMSVDKRFGVYRTCFVTVFYYLHI